MYILSPKRLVAPFFSRFQRWVCRASQVMMDDGTSVEDAVSEIAQSGGSGSAAPRVITLWGEGERSTGTMNTVNYTLTFGGEETHDDSDNYVPQEDIDYIFAHKGELVAIAQAFNGIFAIGYIESMIDGDNIALVCCICTVPGSFLPSNMEGHLSFQIRIDKENHTFTIIIDAAGSDPGR